MKCTITVFIRKKIKGQKRLGFIIDMPACDEERSCGIQMAIGEAASFIEREYRTTLPAYQIKQAQGSNFFKKYYRINFTEQQKADIRRNCNPGVRQNLLDNDFAGTVIINVWQ